MVTIDRDYTISDADLAMFVSNLVQTMTRDIDEFQQFAVDSDDISDIEALGNDFEMFPPDIFYLSDIGVATLDKDKKRSVLLLATRKITNRALIKWGQNSPQYNKFGVKGISELPDKSFLATTRLVILSAEKYLAQLEDEGLTQEIINDYGSLTQEFEDALNALNDAIEIRDIKTRERIELGNQLYKLVVKYCTLGKTIWEGVNEAKYNDYIIYNNASAGSLVAPQNFGFDSISKVFTWNVVNNATSYELQKSTDGLTYTEYWAGPETTCQYQESPNSAVYFRVRARNSNGFGPFSNVIEYNFTPILPAPENFIFYYGTNIFTWNAVVGANDYELVRKEENEDNEWITVYNGSSTFYNFELIAGTWEFKVRANLSGIHGEWSNVVVVNVAP